MKYKNKSNFLPTVKFYKNKFFNHDLRRSILEFMAILDFRYK